MYIVEYIQQMDTGILYIYYVNLIPEQSQKLLGTVTREFSALFYAKRTRLYSTISLVFFFWFSLYWIIQTVPPVQIMCKISPDSKSPGEWMAIVLLEFSPGSPYTDFSKYLNVY